MTETHNLDTTTPLFKGAGQWVTGHEERSGKKERQGPVLGGYGGQVAFSLCVTFG